ncbi:hypothetical protein K4B79_18810 [Streptomyces lincolnensis]|uniref:hypothetical protein n=1 Tax=Streptomyces lincolnensis TaxID=1915 RepID=UPI001E382CC5|nr:hypothetical protein [Streptomyces lincolnensis]MCD7440267.1 hypothetical protein [Streptomyces lincolnensis]
MSRPTPSRTVDRRARTHIKALIDEAKHQTATSPMPAQMFFAGMLSGLGAALEVIDGGTAEGSMEAIVQKMSAAIGQAYLDGKLPPQPRRLLSCGFCYEEQGEEVHPHPECPIGTTTVQRVLDLYEQWVKAGPPKLGTPIAREWDRRLAELRAAIHGPVSPVVTGVTGDPHATLNHARTLAPMLEGLHTLLATSSRDWGEYRVDAWLWAVLCGWDCEQTEHDDSCTHGAMEEMQQRHGWDDEAVAKARRYREAVRAIAALDGAEQTTTKED